LSGLIVLAAAFLGVGDTPRGSGLPSSVPPDPAAVEFFEKSVRPILAARCQGCHGPAKQKGGLRLDSRARILAGGSTGPAVVPGDPAESLLVDAINYGEMYQMPPKSRLPAEEIRTLTEWVRRGAPWGVEVPDPGLSALNAQQGSALPFQLSASEFQKRAQFWCFQPIRRPAPPAAAGCFAAWARNPIDRFILAALHAHGLAPAAEAERRVLIRRLSYDLIGLPPSADEVAAFLTDNAPNAYEKLVERLLASPRYGERWARHWLDLVRYGETAGHEYDYDIPGAFGYRDYVIRAFNLDLPYDQLVLEHLAGDLVDSPRRHPALGFNESIIGTGFYFLGETAHSPVDVREDQMRRVENQIDVLGKTFLGLTLGCARCHDHKFDPITSADYYALAGFLCCSRHQQAFVDAPEARAGDLRRLAGCKQEIARELRDAAALLPGSLARLVAVMEGSSLPAAAPARAARGISQPAERGQPGVLEDFNSDSYDGWFVAGDAFGARPSRKGDFRLEWQDGKPQLQAVRPGIAHSGLLCNRLAGVLRSPTFTIQSRYVHYRAAGRGGRLNVVVDGYEKIRDPIYGGLTTRVDHGEEPRWITQDLEMWRGHAAYLEIADGAVVDFGGTTSQLDEGHGYIAVDEIRLSDQRAPSDAPAGPAQPSMVALADVISGLRVRHPAQAARMQVLLDRVRQLDERIAQPSLALAIADGSGSNERIHVRGSHKNLGEIVPRRFLRVLGGHGPSPNEPGSGRLELAQAVIDAQANPLPARVLVNRLWKHHFGTGIVSTPDDFGAMGRRPSHPELLDWLASELLARRWSIKAMHRLLVTSSTYRMTSVPRALAERLDPANTYLHRMNVRRLEAEAIRDSILSASGQLASTMYGPSVAVHLTSFMEGRGRPARSGPLDGAGRRSIYLAVRRNFLNPMFLAFDAPVPFSTMGRRNVSNVPAQALILLNDPFIAAQAQLWARQVLSKPAPDAHARIDELFEIALGRHPWQQELRDCCQFLVAAAQAHGSAHTSGEEPASLAWADLCHVLFNMKEFLFVE
jgi:Protein of unknown function (DUF1553)/Protein of unknown function (DUF1549)/Planctomycete cytochrome C